MTKLKELIRDTRGATATEYLILLGLVALFCIGAWRTFGTNLQTKINGEASQVNTIP